ncbi:MAG: T9SS type A sorting domain-containing protein [Bacteroidetes bacterium]|nr:T9SS type A sorting domain-containing protein [Bacteroidota bacterium]
MWAKQICKNTGWYPKGLALDKHGNVYTAGNFEGTADFNPGNGIYNLSASGVEMFVSKVDSSGGFVYAELIGKDGLATPFDIATDSLGNLYMAGEFKWAPDFDPGSASFTMTPNGGKDMFLLKIDSTGNFLWGKQIGDIYDDRMQSINVSGSHLYATGYYAGAPDFDPGPSVVTHTSYSASAFVNEFDLNGNYVWSVGFSSYQMFGTSISSDNYGSLYSCGYFQNTTDFDPSASTYTLTAPSGGDTYVCKLGVTVTGLLHHTINSNISLYPNPAQNEIIIKGTSPEEKIEVAIRTLQGQVLITGLLMGNEHAINIKDLPEGCYIVSIQSKSFITNFKLIKQ